MRWRTGLRLGYQGAFLALSKASHATMANARPANAREGQLMTPSRRFRAGEFMEAMNVALEFADKEHAPVN